MTSLGQRLREARLGLGLNQKEAADALGLSNVVLNRYERDERRPDPGVLADIAHAYRVSVDWLLGLTDARELPTEEELLAQLPPEVKAAFRGRGWADLDPETRKHIAWAISMDLDRLKAKKKEEEESENGRTE